MKFQDLGDLRPPEADVAKARDELLNRSEREGCAHRASVAGANSAAENRSATKAVPDAPGQHRHALIYLAAIVLNSASAFGRYAPGRPRVF